MIFDKAQAIMWKAYSDVVLRKKGYELHFMTPTRATFRKCEKPPSQEPPPPEGENEASGTQQ